MLNVFRRVRRALWLTVGALFVFAIMANSVCAEEGAPSWQPPPPMPDDFDWVQLTSGEWLKGEIVAMYEEKLEFDSDKLDLQSLDWEDVKELRSAGPMQVGFGDRSVVDGKILVDEETIRFVGEEDRQLKYIGLKPWQISRRRPA